MKWVIVNDCMQSGYRYELSARMGRDFDPEVKPELTPAEMLSLGVFCGKYMTDTRKELRLGCRCCESSRGPLRKPPGRRRELLLPSAKIAFRSVMAIFSGAPGGV
jgi:hypothetical protein